MPNRSDRVQREVEELLSNLEKFPPKRPRRSLGATLSAPFRAIGRGLGGFRLPRINAGHILLAAIVIIVVAYVAGGSSSIWTWIIGAGIALFILAFIMSMRRQSRPPEKYWRDRPLDLHGKAPGRSFWDRWRGR